MSSPHPPPHHPHHHHHLLPPHHPHYPWSKGWSRDFLVNVHSIILPLPLSALSSSSLSSLITVIIIVVIILNITLCWDCFLWSWGRLVHPDIYSGSSFCLCLIKFVPIVGIHQHLVCTILHLMCAILQLVGTIGWWSSSSASSSIVGSVGLFWKKLGQTGTLWYLSWS